MTDNLEVWNKHADIDPKFTKPITGKAYKGTSPSPQHVIWCLTDLFGPVGEGFGWSVLADGFQPLGDEVLHWCRIRFWHSSPENAYEAYGQTKAYMRTSKGFMADEDAPKKSLTDAIVKAASQLGIAANIFLGRWDDQKYVAQVAKDMASETESADASESVGTDEPQFNAVAARDRLLALIAKQKTKADLETLWASEHSALGGLKDTDAAKFAEVKVAFAKAAGSFGSKPANADLGGDQIPY